MTFVGVPPGAQGRDDWQVTSGSAIGKNVAGSAFVAGSRQSGNAGVSYSNGH